jgi:siroheme synthase-like protein
MPGYPIELDLRGRRVLVVGLGRVGMRKAAGLVEAGAHVLGVDPRRDLEVPSGVEHRPEEFRSEHLEGMSLAFAAAAPEVNREVVHAARQAGIWVNAASEPEMGDFAVPAVWREGLVTLAVSTSGASPSLARTLRDRAASAIAGGPALAGLLAEVRPIVLERVVDPEIRRGLLADWGSARWLDRLANDGPEAVRAAWMEEIAVMIRGDTGGPEAAPGESTLPENPDLS